MFFIMKIEELKKHKKILILGYGIEGRVTHEFLKRHVPDSEIGIADQKDGDDYLDKQADYDLVIKSPGIPGRLVTQKHTTATNIFFANVDRPIIGVTGTKGKSTTVSLIDAILREGGLNSRLVGNIGTPMLGELLNEIPEDVVYVCELSSYQLEDIDYSPHISVMLNIFPEHMDHHGSFENYRLAKERILSHVTSDDYFVYNPDYQELEKLAGETKAKAIPFEHELTFSMDEIKLKGEHNKMNIRSAVTVARIMGVKDEEIKNAIKAFETLPHRLEFVGRYKGIDFYDDAISTTPESTIAALNSIDNTETIFLGGMDRGYEFSSLAQKLVSSLVKNIILFPDSGRAIKKAINVKCQELGVKCDFQFLETENMEDAVKFAYKNTSEGMAVLLSCASPSYSLWKNFEEKGDLFKKFVQKHGRNRT